MKLAYLTASFPFGTGETFLIPEITALTKVGAELQVIPLYPRGPRRTDWDPKSERVQILEAGLLSLRIACSAASMAAARPILSASAVSSVIGGSIRHAAKNLAVTTKAMWVAREIGRAKCDHLHVHWGGTTASAGMIAARMTGISWSLTCHRWDIYENNLLAEKARSASFVRFISAKGIRDAVSLGVDEGRAHVIRMGTTVPQEIAPLKWPRCGPLTILCPANLVPVKGHTFLFAACAELVRDGLDIKLLLAGDGPLLPDLKAEALRLGLDHRVVFLGHLARPDLLEKYVRREVHLVVLPSVDRGGGEHEGVPVSLMEAMAYGVPVLSTRTGSIPELLPDELGLTVPQRDPHAIAEAVRYITTNQERYRALGELCRARILEGWSADAAAARLLELVRPVCPR